MATTAPGAPGAVSANKAELLAIADAVAREKLIDKVFQAAREQLSTVVQWSDYDAIAMRLQGVTPERPMTHDLLKNLLTGLDASVRKVVVNELRDDTFFAVIWVERDGRFDRR